MSNKKQFAAIDIAKYVSALLVVCIHTYPFYEISKTFNLFWLSTICRLAVPFFFVTSAFFFFKKWNQEGVNSNELLLKYLKRLAKLYIVWTILYIPYSIWDRWDGGFSFISLLSYIRDFLINGSYYHLWFLPALMLSVALVSYIYQKKGLKFVLKVSLGLYIFGYLVNIYGPIWQDMPIVQIFYGFFIKVFGTARNGLFFGPIYVSIGLLLSKTRRLPKRVNIVGFAFAMAGVIAEAFVYNQIGVLRELSSMFLFLVPATYFLVNFLLKVSLPYKPIYKKLRVDSSLIYTSHILFVKIFLVIFPYAHLVVYFLTLACAQALASFVRKNKERFPILKNLM